MGPSLYDALSPQANGDSDMTFFDRDNLMAKMSEYEVNRHYTQKAWEFVRTHPGRTLELAAIRQTEYFETLRKDYEPVRWLSWLVVGLVASAGVLVGLNTMYGAVVGRVPELATLQTIGFSRRAAVLSIVQEGTILAMAAALLASAVSSLFVHRLAVRFTMGAFELQIDSGTLLIGYGIALFLGVCGSLPPAVRVFRLSVVDGLKAI